MGTVEDIFGEVVGEGYVKVEAEQPLSGFEVVANQESIESLSGKTAAAAGFLRSPHFFVDPHGGSSVVRLLNTSNSETSATIRAYGDQSQLLAEKTLEIGPGQLAVEDLRTVLGLADSSPATTITGVLEIRLGSFGRLPKVLGTLTFQGQNGRSSTTVPLVSKGLRETVFPQVAQTSDGSIFTGFSILNPNNQQVEVTIEAYDELGYQTATANFELAPGERRIDLLRSLTFFGEDFQQVKGHVRVKGSAELITYAIFGDAKGEFLSTIEGQSPLQ
jgi:hypothetical protein